MLLQQIKKIALLWVLIGSTFAEASVEDAFILAREAYDNKDVLSLADSSSRLHNQGYLLAPYTNYWMMMLNIEDSSNQQIQSFINRYQDYPFVDTVRGAWLKQLGELQDWSTFNQQYQLYNGKDAAVKCYAAEANANLLGYETLHEAVDLWFKDRAQPSNCDNVYNKLQAANLITQADIIQRMRMALAKNRVTLTRSIAGRAEVNRKSFRKWIGAAYANPKTSIKKRSISTSNIYGKEAYLYALYRIARKDSEAAIAAFNSIAHIFTPEQVSYFYASVATQAAKRHEPSALSWFGRAHNTKMHKEQLEWYARSALRLNKWDKLLEATALMPEALREHATWRYWRGRALRAQGQETEANQLFASISGERHYYGWLAQEELGDTMGARTEFFEADKTEVAAIGQMPEVQRAKALFGMEFKWEAKKEWYQAISGLDDKQLIAAATYANQQGWYDISVHTADRTRQTHNFALRYPAPYRHLLKPAAYLQGIDEAWAYGIIRQESRFMHYAKSHAGAQGLMQVMPKTARWIAKKMGWTDYHNGMINQLDTNVSLGTYYLGYTLNQFNGQEAMASAAYNAGPGRAKRWAGKFNDLEGAIYAETIPFNETRNYVKRVLANAHLYAPQLGLKTMTLKQRLGVVPAKN